MYTLLPIDGICLFRYLVPLFTQMIFSHSSPVNRRGYRYKETRYLQNIEDIHKLRAGFCGHRCGKEERTPAFVSSSSIKNDTITQTTNQVSILTQKDDTTSPKSKQGKRLKWKVVRKKERCERCESMHVHLMSFKKWTK